MPLRTSLLCAFFIPFLTVHAFANLVAYDDVDANAGQLHGVSTGWNFYSWDVQNGDTTTFAVRSPGLAFSNLLVAGNAASGGGQYLSSGIGIRMPAPWDTANEWVPYRYDASGQYMAGLDGTTLWASMLVSQWADSDDFTISFHEGNIRWLEGNVGLRIKPAAGVWRMEQKNGPSVSTGVARIPGHNYLMVCKMEFINTSTDRVTLYVNPTPGLSAPDVNGTVINTSSNFYFRSIMFNPGQNRYLGFLDEMRFGSTYADVVPAGAEYAGSDPDPFRIYLIGNSVTDQVNYDGFRLMGVAEQHVHCWGRHVIPGSPLDYIWNNPGSGFQESPYAYYPTALPNWHWQAVSLQPFDRQLASDTNYCSRFIDLARTNPANADTQFYIYSRWPRKNDDGTLDYAAKWLRHYTGGGQTEESREYFELLVDALRVAYPAIAKPIRMVPVGDVLYELDKRMEAGQVPGFSDVCDVYSDGIHFNATGQFIVATTFFATMYKENPRGLPVPSNFGTIASAVVAQIQDAAWEVVSTHKYSGVGRAGDFEPDGDVDWFDVESFFDVWLDNDCDDTNGYCGSADINKDGTVDFADFAALAANYGAKPWSP